jgi:leucyl aminopeptidase
MRIHTEKTGKEELIIIPLIEGEELKGLSPRLTTFLKQKKPLFTGKPGTVLDCHGKQDVLFIGLDPVKDDDALRKLAGTAAKEARKRKCGRYAIDLNGFPPRQTQAVAEGTILGLYKYEEYKKREKDEAKDPLELTLIVKDHPEAAKAAHRGKVIAEGVCFVRDLVNKPASAKAPRVIAALAQDLGKQYGFNVTVLGRKDLERLRMGCMLGVAKGSDKEPCLVLLDLHPTAGKPLALVGKGVVFDAGGLDIKPSGGMLNMKTDMAGAATVLATMVILARLGHQGHVVGAMGLVENMLGPDAYKPKDILTARNGKTIEVLNTDAEGRLVLADALTYVEETYQPEAMVDIATLTGAAIIALGYRVTAVLGNDAALMTEVKEASKVTDELVWELPLYDHYKDLVKGSISDLINVGKGAGYSPGTSVGAAFLLNFVEKTPWAHLDIAGTSYNEEETAYVPQGGTGWGVRLLVELARKHDHPLPMDGKKVKKKAKKRK